MGCDLPVVTEWWEQRERELADADTSARTRLLLVAGVE